MERERLRRTPGRCFNVHLAGFGGLTGVSGGSAAVALRPLQLVSIVQASGGLLPVGFPGGHGPLGFLDNAHGHVGAGQTHLLLQRRAGQVAGVYQTQVAVLQRPGRVKGVKKGLIFAFTFLLNASVL